MDDNWNSGIAYDRYMGRWSKRVASDFLSWLAIPPAHTWMDVGAGTGSLTKSILEGHQPKKVISVDPSTNFISHAKRSITEPTVNFVASVAQSLGLKSNAVDVTVSGLVLNFVPQPETALQEMKRATQSGGTIGVFI